MLWCDKYRPTSLDQLTYNNDTTNLLKKMGASRTFPHLIFSGQSGSGRKTRISAFLREVFGPQAQKLKLEEKEINGTVLPIVSSPYHLEVSATTGGRRAVQDLIKDTAQTRPIDARTPFKVIVVHEADQLSKEAQQALRRTMEKTAGACRLILCCDEVSRLIEPIRSRACHIRIQAPSDAAVEETMHMIAHKEKFEFPPAFGKKVVALADGNMRKALLILESEHVKGTYTNPTLTDWENAVRSIVTEIVTKQGSDQQKLLNCRMLLYELLAHCIPPHVILLTLLNEIRLAVDGTVATDAAIWAAVYVFLHTLKPNHFSPQPSSKNLTKYPSLPFSFSLPSSFSFCLILITS